MTTDTQKLDGRTAALFALAVALMVALVVAWRIEAKATTSPPEHDYSLRVVDESGSPVTGATIEVAGETVTTASDGTVELPLRAPELAVIRATGMVPDAIVVGNRDITTVTLLASTGPGGRRTVMHFAGDFMMGRRFLEPDDGSEPLVTDEASARAVVSDIAPLFELADLSTVNLESVIGTLAAEDAYPGKRYLLQSPPATVAALDELGVDLVTLGNNHANDWLDSGLASTLRHLDDAGMAHTGAGPSQDQAAQPTLVPAGDLTVAVVSMTTVTGDYVNDNLPNTTAPVPATIADVDRWQYEERDFAFGVAGEPAYVAADARRPGEIWRLFETIESELTNRDAADLWSAVVRVYPELQDWVARRGHGGAALYSPAAVEAAVTGARTAGADLVVVQLHGGYQFAEVSSDYFGRATRAAVDAGADLVIGHHPHILQGFEIYEDTLIAYSLGNFVFDQEFLATHPSVVLRTVFEGTELIEATIYPLIVDRYRPVAVGGEVADRILRQVNEASLQNAESLRLPDRWIGSTRTTAPVTAMVVAEQGRGRVQPVVTPGTATVAVSASVPESLGGQLVRVGTETAGLLLGRDIFGYGTLEDAQSDGVAAGGLEWSVPPDTLVIDPTSPAGPWVVRLDRTSQHINDIVARTAARVSLPPHRWFDENGAPADGAATYAVRVWAKRIGAGIPFVRIYFYEFDDTDPTREPDSAHLGTVDIELPLVNDGEWHELWVDVPGLPDGANAALVGVGLSPPQSQSGTVWIDGLQVVEWRQADETPAGTWVPVDYLTGTGFTEITLVTAPT
jgi:poly-gamma-glutamate capsule biosynthesis protein CapA/YwtB (metallophosphatase superfamily)